MSWEMRQDFSTQMDLNSSILKADWELRERCAREIEWIFKFWFFYHFLLDLQFHWIASREFSMDAGQFRKFSKTSEQLLWNNWNALKSIFHSFGILSQWKPNRSRVKWTDGWCNTKDRNWNSFWIIWRIWIVSTRSISCLFPDNSAFTSQTNYNSIIVFGSFLFILVIQSK